MRRPAESEDSLDKIAAKSGVEGEQACPVCGVEDTRQELQLGQYRIMQCRGCTVQFCSPQPDDQVLSSIYSKDYFLSERDGIPTSEVSRLKRETAKLYVDEILSLRDSLSGKTLLEIGCGSGDFLLEAQRRGLDVRGLELSPYATALANVRLGAEKVVCGYIETAGLPQATFDLVVFSDVLEHVRNPRAFLKNVHRCLKPGGLVFIVTPSTDSWSRRLMRQHWMEYKIEHLFYFNRRSLQLILGSEHFEDIRFHKNRKVLSFQYVRAHFRRFPAPLWTPVVETIGLLLPGRFASFAFKVVASGVIATATKAR